MVGPIALFVVHTWPDSDPVTGTAIGRIISARKATKHERKPMKKGISKTLSAEQARELATLAALPDGAINTLATPEQKDWAGAHRGLFYRPIKQQLTLRLDADIVDWFKSHAPDGQGYQTTINSALREYIGQHDR